MANVPIIGQGPPPSPAGGAPPDGPEEPGVGINIEVGGVQGPDIPGRAPELWVTCIITLGLTKFQLTIPPRTAEELGPILLSRLTEGAKQVRRINSGIILPTDMPANVLQFPPGGVNGRSN